MASTSDTRRVFLGGEGRSELGSRSGHSVYQSDDEPGVLQTLLRRVASVEWIVVEALNWKDIPKLRVGRARSDDWSVEKYNVLALVDRAAALGCDLVAFTRDQDGDERRGRAVLVGIEEAEKTMSVVGGVAVQCIESWLLAMRGILRTETMGRTKVDEGVRSAAIGDVATMVAVVESADLTNLPKDAVSLNAWLQRAKLALSE